MHLTTYLGLLHSSLRTLADAFRQVGQGHGAEAEVRRACEALASRVDEQVAALAPVLRRYGEHREPEPERLHAAALQSTRGGPVGLLRDLQDLHVLASLADTTWLVVGQAAQGLRDRELVELVRSGERETARQLDWLRTRLKTSAPRVLTAPT